MCGRFSLNPTPEQVEELFGLADLEAFPPRYNIAPTEPVLVVTAGPTPEPGSNRPPRRSLLVRWGFLPSWVKDPKDFPLLINARAETAAGKASFRNAMRHRRVLIPASGFYEWKRDPGERPKAYWVPPADGGVIAFAGLMETWSGHEGSEVDTAAILTTAANADVAAIHHRMPVVIKPQDFARWLDCKSQEPRHVADLLEPAPVGFFKPIRVSDKVNKVANSGPDIQEPLAKAKDEAKADADAAGAGGGQLDLF